MITAIKLLGYTIAAAVVVALILCLPFATIWMINVFGQTLWPDRQLPYTVETWMAACLLSAVFTPSFNRKKD
jgi:hypothetical protein